MRAALGRNVVINMVNVAVSLGASLVTLPFILRHIGTSGYGIWVLGFTFVSYLAIADNGFGPAIQRWVGLAHGRGEGDAARRVLWSALAGYSLIALVAGGGVALGAAVWTDLFVSHANPLHDDAIAMFRLVGLALVFTLWLTALGNVLQGLERFGVITISSIAGSVVYFAGVFTLVGSGHGLEGLAWTLVAQQAVVGLVRLVALWPLLTAGRPVLLTRRETREVAAFAGQLQINAFAALVNTQSDKVVVGLVTNPHTVGELGIAQQLIDAGRLVATAALTPVVSALAVTVGTGDTARLRTQFAWMHRTWIYAVLGGTAVGLGALGPMLEGWLGDHHEAIVLGLILVLGAGVALSIGTGLAYLRAVGRPEVEARYGPLVVVVNVALTVPFGIAFGARGVVLGTLGAWVAGTIWFLRRFRRTAPEVEHLRPGDLLRPTAYAIVAGGVALGLGLGCVAAFPRGVALLPVLACAAFAFVGYLSAVTGRRPTPRGLRELIAGLRGAPA